jgi:hypothetical protein
MSVIEEMRLKQLEGQVKAFRAWLDDETGPDRSNTWVLQQAMHFCCGIEELGLIAAKREQLERDGQS